MIPSDHFVRFYNEVFKFLDERNALADYYVEISRHQELHCMDLYWNKGLQGMFEYAQRIIKEENCVADIDMVMDGKAYMWHMIKCPSLSKVIDNDAGPCRKYCRHCPGWGMPLYTKAGYYYVYNLVDEMVPECYEYATEDKETAEALHRKLLADGVSPDLIVTNLDQEATIEAAKARRHAGLPFQPAEGDN